ncbi:MAG: ThiF family adenylyltransferase [Desulfovibrionaceae bacterium]|nr:ThiF family adenylyltransferase [Desulfovibrionaceae bacterium]
MSALADDIRALSRSITLPWGEEGDILSLDHVLDLSRRHGVSGRIVEIKALRLGIRPLRYLRNQQSLSPEDQARLLESAVAMVGLGGLGGTLLEVLLRAGAGIIRCADGDRFEESNLNRQTLSTPAGLGRSKTDMARERAEALNPSVDFEAENAYLTSRSLPDFLSGCRVAVDALGGLSHRLELQRAAAGAGIPMVTGALAGFSGYVGVVLPGDTGPADIMGRDNAAEESLGCPSPSVTCIAALMAAEIIRLSIGHPSPLAGKMLVADLQAMSFETVAIA